MIVDCFHHFRENILSTLIWMFWYLSDSASAATGWPGWLWKSFCWHYGRKFWLLTRLLATIVVGGTYNKTFNKTFSALYKADTFGMLELPSQSQQNNIVSDQTGRPVYVCLLKSQDALNSHKAHEKNFAPGRRGGAARHATWSQCPAAQCWWLWMNGDGDVKAI